MFFKHIQVLIYGIADYLLMINFNQRLINAIPDYQIRLKLFLFIFIGIIFSLYVNMLISGFIIRIFNGKAAKINDYLEYIIPKWLLCALISEIISIFLSYITDNSLILNTPWALIGILLIYYMNNYCEKFDLKKTNKHIALCIIYILIIAL